MKLKAPDLDVHLSTEHGAEGECAANFGHLQQAPGEEWSGRSKCQMLFCADSVSLGGEGASGRAFTWEGPKIMK